MSLLSVLFTASVSSINHGNFSFLRKIIPYVYLFVTYLMMAWIIALLVIQIIHTLSRIPFVLILLCN